MEAIIHTRDLLNTTLHQSTQLDSAINKTTANVTRINRTFLSLESRIKNMASKCAIFAICDHVDRALPPLSAVFNIYQLVDELGSLLSAAHSSSDLNLYLSLLTRFRQALTLLTNTCKLAILWVQDVKQFLDNTDINVFLADDDLYHSNVCKTLLLLEELQATEDHSLLDQGILSVAFQQLEHEFTNLLIQNTVPLQVPSSLFSSGDEEGDVADPSPEALPLYVVHSLKAIVACFACDSQLHRCMSIYIKVRTTIVQTSLQGLDLDYLGMSLSEFDSVQEIEGYIDEWGRHLEFVVKHLLELEYRLCDQVFGHNVQPDVWADCFSKIALQSGIQRFIKFGNTITKGKKEAIKLFKLLDVFAALNNLRQDFNRIFGGKPCSEIQTQTRNLIKKVVNGTYEIFWELSAQVELQRLTDPPADGAVPRLMTFVTEYSDELLDDDYKPVLEQVLKIHSSWYNADTFTKGLVSVEVHNMVKSLELNLETWAKRYQDTALSYIFMMNTSCYLSKHLKGTKLGDLMGESWLKRHEGRVEYYAALYLRGSWGKIPALLNNNDKMMALDEGVIAQDVVNKRIKGFNEAFDDLFRKQSDWVLCDKSLRWKTCQLIVEAIVPVYKSYMQKYLGLVEGGGTPNPNKYVKYSVESLENMLTSMFQPKLGKNGSNTKHTNMIGKIKNVVAGRFSPTTDMQRLLS
ncbi:exocyst complex component EXO70A1 [Cynara cardunculus var. scolymus]|uniref:exocyst complex component EXO70A1 n=1 Tax=Cynara cardunculus var. scolymus TaxID=59895 RepID=UPI000D62C6EE|nr:exocyst complex component EXO70A1 [Cynara cardunculus var. scolymus]